MQVNFHGKFEVEAREILTKQFHDHFHDTALQGIKVNLYFDFARGSEIDPNDFNVLLLHEPRSVTPWQYQKDILSQFQLLIPFSPWRGEILGTTAWAYHPYKFSNQTDFSGTDRDIWISMINAAKYSSGVTSNYGLRRQVSKILTEQGINFRLYGWDWNSAISDELRRRAFGIRESVLAHEKISWTETLSNLFYKYDSYQNGIADKSVILQRSELTLIIENDCDWITEKLFDAFTFRAVPIYVGPSFEKYLPGLEKCIIRCEREASAVIERIKGITPAEVNSKRLEIDKLMSGGTLIKELEFEQVWEKIGEMVISQISKQKFNYLT
jgi:hypothetical protein